MTDEPRLLRVDEAARRLAVGTTLLRSMIRSRELPSLHLGRAVRIDPHDLDAFIEKKKAAGAYHASGPVEMEARRDISSIRRTGSG